MATKMITAQMYTIRQSTRTAADLAASFEKLAGIGYSLVQISAIGPVPPAEVKRMMDDNGIRCAATHTGWDELTEGLDELIDELKTLDCKLTAIGAMPNAMRNPEGLKPFAEGMAAAATRLAADGIRLGYHNHSFEFEPVAGKLLMDHLLEMTAAAGMWAEIDTYWVQHGGGDPATRIRQVAGRIPMAHFKDMGILGGKQVMREVGEGNLDWPGILAACKDAGVEYYAIEQDDCNGLDPFDCLAISLRNLREMGVE